MNDQLNGIFVEGEHVEEYLKKVEGDKKAKEIEAERLRVERTRGGKIRLAFDKAKGGPRVARRVKRFTDREIRKEYGIMEKPFESHAENCIWVIMEKGPVTVQDIGRELEWKNKVNSLSAMVATVWSRLGNTHEGAAGVIDRYKHGNAYVYKKTEGVDVSVEAAIEKYKLIGKKQWQAKSGKKDESATIVDLGDPVDKVAIVKNGVEEVLGETLSKVLGVKVEVSGSVEFIFRLGG